MLKVIWRGFLSRKLRSALTAVAILLGVSMISGTFVLTDKINGAFTDIFQAGNKNIDVTIWKQAAFGPAASSSSGVPFDASMLARVQRVDGVRQASASLYASGFLVKGTKKLIARGGAPSILASTEPVGITPYSVETGDFPSRSGEVAVNEKLASDEHLRLGDRLRLSTATGLQPVKITGIVKFGNVTSIGGATIVLARLADVQHWSNLDGKATGISIAARPGVGEAVLANRIRSLVPSQLTVQTGTENADQQASAVAKSLSFLNYLLLAFGFVAVLVGAFIIFNTYSNTVAQRTHEFGVLRTLGATGRQTLAAVLGEALIVGAIATTLGILGGVAFAALLTWVFDALGFGIPSVGTVVQARTIVWAVSVGLGVTIVAALMPALRATRVAPIAALRAGITAPARKHRWYKLGAAGIFLLLAAALLAYGTTAGGALTGRLLTVAAGAVCFFFAVALAMAYLVRPVVAVLGTVVRRLGGAGKLATSNTTRNPSRTAVTAASLMIGTGLVVFVAILGSGLKASFGDSLTRSIRGDLVVTAETQGMPIPSASVPALRRVPGVALTSSVAGTPARIQGTNQTELFGVDPATFAQVYTFDWTRGEQRLVSQLGRSGALVERSVADAGNLRQGSSVRVETQMGETRTFHVIGIYKDANILNGVVVSSASLRPLLPPGATGVNFVFLKSAPGQSTADVQQRVKLALLPFAVAQVQSRAELKKQAESSVNQLLAIFYALLAMSVIISLFGIVNTLV
ncbi:MAG: putative transport system permease protein, partial [Gaiellales bacterium]|nr:putative transport system permease protein [Gaiellales bacterium]